MLYIEVLITLTKKDFNESILTGSPPEANEIDCI